MRPIKFLPPTASVVWTFEGLEAAGWLGQVCFVTYSVKPLNYNQSVESFTIELL